MCVSILESNPRNVSEAFLQVKQEFTTQKKRDALGPFHEWCVAFRSFGSGRRGGSYRNCEVEVWVIIVDNTDAMY